VTNAVRWAACLATLSACLVLGPPPTSAQDRGAAREESRAPSSDRSEDEPVKADAEVVDSGGEKVKVFRFGGLDISGELRSPQVLYFLNRLRAVFDRPRLPHRSFMPELVRSTREGEF
jgi:hypothetical protein